MKRWVSLLAVALLVAAPAILRAADSRFSDTLSKPELAETGLNRLNSDQIAVIDALVRRDLSGQSSRNETPRPARFSQRLYDEERSAAGFALLKAEELARLDALVERFSVMLSARALSAPLVIAPSNARSVRVVEAKTGPEWHGSFSFSMGWGKGGYSERTGAMNLNYEDPAHGFALSVGYAETHVKGAGAYILRDPADVGAPPLVP